MPYVTYAGGGNVVLVSVQYPGQHVGVYPDGTVKEPGKTGTGAHAQFVVIKHKKVNTHCIYYSMCVVPL